MEIIRSHLHLACLAGFEYRRRHLQVVSGNRANAMTVLLDVEGRYSKDQTLRSEESPNFVVRSMPELAELLQSTLQLAEVKQAR